MKQIQITINGSAYPCAPTMGAMVRYSKLRGKEVTEIGNSLSEMCAYLYCCVVSACNRDKVAFDMEFLDFADLVDYDELTRWATQINNQALEAEKKRPAKKSR